MPERSTKPKGTPFTAEDRRFVRAVYPALGPAAIAKKLGRSKSGVCGLIREMKESGELPAAPPGGESARGCEPAGACGPPFEAEGEPQDTLARLRWVRDLLERHLRGCEPTQAARLAKEYRDTVDEIARMEGADGSGGDVVGSFAAAIAQRLG